MSGSNSPATFIYISFFRSGIDHSYNFLCPAGSTQMDIFLLSILK